MKTIKILLVDDHPMMREALRMVIESEEDMDVIGEAHDGQEALHLLETLQPDVILMDLLLPKMGGIETTEKIISQNPEARIMVLTSMEDEERILGAIQAGALGYYPKTAPRNYLLEGIRKVADGIPYLPAGIAQKLFHSLRNAKINLSNEEMIETLTTRQEEVLKLLSEGKSDNEIANVLSVSNATVRSHISHILQRVGLETRAQLMAFASQQMTGQDPE